MSNSSHNSSGNYNSNCSIINTTSFNATDCSNSRWNPAANPWALFQEVAYYSSFSIIAIAIVTILGNALLLFVFAKDPLKTFRTPTSLFLISLALADLLTALTTEPFNAACFQMIHYSHPDLKTICTPLFQAGQRISFISMNMSFFTVLEFTVTQFIAIKSPLKYGRRITRAKVMTCTLLSWAYCILYTSLFVIVENREALDVLHKVDIFFHSIIMIFVILLFYGFLYRVFRRKIADGAMLRRESTAEHDGGNNKTNRLQRKFVMLNLFLIVLLFLCALPSTALKIVLYYWYDAKSTPNLLTAQLIGDILLYLKFMLDPFIYAWRLPQYREALIFMAKEGRERRNGHTVPRSKSSASCNRTNSLGNISLSNFEPEQPNNQNSLRNTSSQEQENVGEPPAYSSVVIAPQSLPTHLPQDQRNNVVQESNEYDTAPPQYHQRNLPPDLPYANHLSPHVQSHDTRL